MRFLSNIKLNKIQSAAILISIIILFFAVVLPMLLYPKINGMFTSIDSWQITESGVSATLLWQRQGFEDRTRYHRANPTLLVADNVVLYWQAIDYLHGITTPHLIGLDIQTGDELWRLATENSITRIYGVTDGFLIVSPVQMKLVDTQGQIVWVQGSAASVVPLRDVIAVYDEDNILHILTYRRIYHLDKATALVLSRDDIPEAVYYADGKALTIASETQLQLINLNQDSRLEYTLEFDRSWFPSGRLYPEYFRHVERFENMLLFFLETKGVEAYDFETGELGWSIEKPIYGVPALAGDVLIVYNADNQIELINPLTGVQVGQINLENADEIQATQGLFSRWIAGDNNTIVIRYFGISQLLAIEFATND